MRIILFTYLLIFIMAAPAYAVQTRAPYALLLDYNTGTVLFSKSADTPMGPASMTKLMTAYVLFNELKSGNISLSDNFLISEKAWRKGGSKMFIKEGDQVLVEDLLRGMVVQSGNDASIAIAEGIAGSEEVFVEDMNYMARRIGLTSSHFKNATGWPEEGHVMSVRDLVTLASHIITEFPEYYKYFSEQSFKYNDIEQKNRNGLLWRNIGADGLKTGHTEESGYGQVASAVRDGRRLIVAINGLESDSARTIEAERLLRHGFRDFKLQEFYKKGQEVARREVIYGDDEYVPLVAHEDVIIPISKRVSQQDSVTSKIIISGELQAPVRKGQEIAKIEFYRDNEMIKSIPLYTAADVERAGFFDRLIQRIRGKGPKE